METAGKSDWKEGYMSGFGGKEREGRNEIILPQIFLKRVFLHSIDDNVKGVANRVERKQCLIRNLWRSSTLHHPNIDAAPPHLPSHL